MIFKTPWIEKTAIGDVVTDKRISTFDHQTSRARQTPVTTYFVVLRREGQPDLEMLSGADEQGAYHYVCGFATGVHESLKGKP